MAEKRRKRKRKTKSGARGEGGPGGNVRTGGGVLQSIRTGIRRATGTDDSNEQPSKLSNAIWTALLVAAVALLIYRWYF